MNAIGINEPSMDIHTNIFSKQLQVAELVLYGSRAKGNHYDRSDVDMVIFNSTIARHVLGEIVLDINNNKFSYTIDIQIFENLKNENLVEHIFREGKTIYIKNP